MSVLNYVDKQVKARSYKDYLFQSIDVTNCSAPMVKNIIENMCDTMLEKGSVGIAA